MSENLGILRFILILQALDEEYLKVDAQFGGVDQRKIFTFSKKVRIQLVEHPLRLRAVPRSTLKSGTFFLERFFLFC